MNPSTVRASCSIILVSMVVCAIIMGAYKVAVPAPYIAAAIVAILAAFVGSTQDA